MKKTIKTDKIIEMAKYFADESKQYKEQGKGDLSRHYETLAFGIESALRVLAIDIDEEEIELDCDMIHKAIWGE